MVAVGLSYHLGRIMKLVSTLLAFCGCFGVCYANDAYAIETGAAINFSKSAYVQMVEEDIDIHLRKDDASVQVDFVFKNHGPAHNVVMAFPDIGYSARIPTMKDFKSWVGGATVKVTFRKISEVPEMSSEGAWTKDVYFEQGQTRRVRVSYTVGYSGSTSMDRAFDYILKSGATWKSPIKRTTINVDWSKAETKHPVAFIKKYGGGEFPRLVPSEEWKINGKTGTVTLRNFTPDFDFSLGMFPEFWNISLDGELVRYPRSYLTTWGDPSDLLIPVDTVAQLFGDREGTSWANPLTSKFGGSITFPDDHSMLLGGRRRVELPRPLVVKWGAHIYNPDYGVKMVRLRDLVAALGWKYTYLPISGMIEIKLPE